MDYTLKATVRYDGGAFAGWQVQPQVRTVQGDLERVLSLIAREPVRIRGASRTDAGVHALGQVFAFSWPGRPDHERIRRSVSKLLSPNVRIESIETAEPGFHPQYSAKSKRYAYVIALSKIPDPFYAPYAWCLPWEVDVQRLAALAARYVGSRDFAGYRCSGGEGQPENTVREIFSVDVRSGGVAGLADSPELWRIDFHGSGFLYKMVRNLTATLVEVASCRLDENCIEERFASPGPFRGYTAPAHGLFLLEVLY